MKKLKQGTAAIALVASLGLIAPSTFGGSASADVSENNRNFVSTTLNCDLDGIEGYEAPFELVSTGSSTMWQDKNSTTVVVQRLTDLQYSTYEVVNDPTNTAVNFFDPIGYWSLEPNAHNYPQANHKGQRRVLCQEVVQYPYAPYLGEADPAPEDVDLFPAEFVQSPDCPDDAEDPALEDPEHPGEFIPREEYKIDGDYVCVTYLETDTWLYEVTLSGKPGGAKVKSASADDDAPSAERQTKAKKGNKHRGKGKRGQ
jgi:hypothetical protein